MQFDYEICFTTTVFMSYVGLEGTVFLEFKLFQKVTEFYLHFFKYFPSLCSLFLHLLWSLVSHAFHHLKLFHCFLQILLINPTFFEVFLS